MAENTNKLLTSLELSIVGLLERSADIAKENDNILAKKALKVASKAVSGAFTAVTEFYQDRDDNNKLNAGLEALILAVTAVGAASLFASLGAPTLIGVIGGAVVSAIATTQVKKVLDLIQDELGFVVFGKTLTVPSNSDGTVFSGTDDGEKINGTSFNEIIFGQDGRDFIRGYGGRDTLYGQEGRDNLYGGSGNDYLFGGGSNHSDILWGGKGNDYLDGGFSSGSKKNDLRGGEDNDRIVVRDLNIVAYGGAGNDWLLSAVKSVDLSSSKFRSIENINLKEAVGSSLIAKDAIGDDGDNYIIGNLQKNMLSGLDGDDTIEGGEKADNIFGGKDNDWLFGGSGNDTLEGGSGRNTLFGGAGDDTLVLTGKESEFAFGGKGDDTIIIKKGHDHTINGGAGEDTLELGGADYFDFDFTNVQGVENIVLNTAFVTHRLIADMTPGETFIFRGNEKLKFETRPDEGVWDEYHLFNLFDGNDFELDQGSTIDFTIKFKGLFGIKQLYDFEAAEYNRFRSTDSWEKVKSLAINESVNSNTGVKTIQVNKLQRVSFENGETYSRSDVLRVTWDTNMEFQNPDDRSMIVFVSESSYVSGGVNFKDNPYYQRSVHKDSVDGNVSHTYSLEVVLPTFDDVTFDPTSLYDFTFSIA